MLTLLAIDGNATSHVFQIGSGETVAIFGLTIRNGQGNFGGGILNGAGATLTITNSTLSGNTAGLRRRHLQFGNTDHR